MAVERLTVVLFGPVTIEVGSREVIPPPGKPTLLLALMALEAAQPVRISTVIDALWDDDPPASARALVYTYVSALRRTLDVPGMPHIETVPGGYRLDCDPADVDVHRFLRASVTDDASAWREALAVSRPALLGGVEAGFLEQWRVQVDIARDALQDRLWSDAISAGRGSAVLSEVRAAVTREPLREDRVLLLAHALGRAGRTEEALKVLDGYRRQLGEELGLDPSTAVAALRDDLLVGKPASLPMHVADVTEDPRDLPAPTEGSARSRGWTIAAAVVVVAVVAFVAVLGWRWAGDRDGSIGDITGPTLISIDPTTGDLLDGTALPIVPTQIESSSDVLTIRSEPDQAVAVVDLGVGDAAKVTGLTAPPSALAMDGDTAVVGLAFSGETVTVTDGRVSPPKPAEEGRAGRLTLAGSPGGVWIATITGEVLPPEGTSGWSRLVRVEGTPWRLAVQDERVWVLINEPGELVALSSADAPPVRSSLRGSGVDLAVDGSEAWVVSSSDDRIWHAATSGRVVATRVLPGPPAAVLADADLVWVAIRSPASVIAFDPQTLEPGTVVDLPREPVDLAAVSERLVVAVR